MGLLAGALPRWVGLCDGVPDGTHGVLGEGGREYAARLASFVFGTQRYVTTLFNFSKNTRQKLYGQILRN